jgi:hypothetical protein
MLEGYVLFISSPEWRTNICIQNRRTNVKPIEAGIADRERVRLPITLGMLTVEESGEMAAEIVPLTPA